MSNIFNTFYFLNLKFVFFKKINTRKNYDIISEKITNFSEKIKEVNMKKSAYNRILSRIYGRGRGWVFSKNDFISEFNSDSIDKTLSQLVKDKKIIRLARGIYYYPKYSKLLKKYISPNIDDVAQAYARKFNWHIQPSGDTALNILGLSTQVPGRYIYLSNGPNKVYNINGVELEFKHTALKESNFKYPLSSLLVQALKTLGKENVDEQIIKTLREKIDKNMCKKILKDTKTVTVWVYEIIKRICKGNNDG